MSKKLQVPIFKAKEKDGDRYFEGFYYHFPRVNLCGAFGDISDKKWEENEAHCITVINQGDWNMSNRIQYVEIDKNTLELVRYEDIEIKEKGKE